MRQSLRAVFVLGFLVSSVLIARAEVLSMVGSDYDSQAPPSSPTQVHAGAYLIDVVQVTGADQVFTADVVVRLAWKDARLAQAGGKVREIPLDQVWSPRMMIANRRNMEMTLPEVVEVSPDGTVVYVQRIMGDFSSRFDLHRFPHDVQTLGIHFVAGGKRGGNVEFVPDLAFTGRADELTLSGWELGNAEMRVQPYVVPRLGLERPGIEIAFQAKRLVGYYAATIFASAAIIVCMAWMVFWLPLDATNPRISVSVTSMLTLIAHRFVVSGELPKLSYLTRMDYFLLGSTFMVLVGLIGVVTVAKVISKDKRPRAERINGIFRWVYPLVFLAILFAAL